MAGLLGDLHPSYGECRSLSCMPYRFTCLRLFHFAYEMLKSEIVFYRNIELGNTSPSMNELQRVCIKAQKRYYPFLISTCLSRSAMFSGTAGYALWEDIR